MRIFRLNKKGCYDLQNAQNNQYIFKIDNNLVETVKFKSKCVDSFFIPRRWLNIGNLFKQCVQIYYNIIIYKRNIRFIYIPIYNYVVLYTEAPPTRYCSRRKSVFAETYNPEEDEEEEGPNVINYNLIVYRYLCIYYF